MGTYVKDGNRCIGCECLPEFPDLCTECTNLKSDVELVKVAEAMRLVLKEADEYLSSNKLNSIGSGSILHEKMKDAIEGRAELPPQKITDPVMPPGGRPYPAPPMDSHRCEHGILMMHCCPECGRGDGLIPPNCSRAGGVH